ncbi:MAG: HAD family hydrolase [Vulcanimicrobiaceae bacterium]
MTLRPAAFLDRDGTLMVDSGFIGDPLRIEILDGVAEALVALAEAGFERIVVTNQSGVARGLFGEPDVERVHRALADELAERGATIDAFYYCAHLLGCDCRKPDIGMVRRAVEERGIDLSRSVMFGDRATDIALAQNAEIPGILVNEMPGYDGPPPLYRARTLLEGARFFLDYARA